jgi:hypothetical protein
MRGTSDRHGAQRSMGGAALPPPKAARGTQPRGQATQARHLPEPVHQRGQAAARTQHGAKAVVERRDAPVHGAAPAATKAQALTERRDAHGAAPAATKASKRRRRRRRRTGAKKGPDVATAAATLKRED